jgi:hypothetical protein
MMTAAASSWALLFLLLTITATAATVSAAAAAASEDADANPAPPGGSPKPQDPPKGTYYQDVHGYLCIGELIHDEAPALQDKRSLLISLTPNPPRLFLSFIFRRSLISFYS